MVRRYGHFEVLCTAKYRYDEKFYHRQIKFYLRTGNPPSAYKQLSSNSSRIRVKIAGPDRRYLFLSGLPTKGIFRIKILGFF
jgi:hypothetical protein